MHLDQNHYENWKFYKSFYFSIPKLQKQAVTFFVTVFYYFCVSNINR